MHYKTSTPFNTYQGIERHLQKEILSEQDSYILGTSSKELTEYYYSKNALSPLLLDLSKTETAEIKKEWRLIPAHQRESGFQGLGDLSFEYEIVHLTIPILPNPNSDVVRGFVSTCYSRQNLKWKADHVLISVEIKGYGFNKNEEEVERLVTSHLDDLHSCIESVNTQIRNLNDSLKSNISNWIELRKEKLQADQERFDSLLKRINIPVKRKSDEIIKRVQLDTKPLIQRVRPFAQALEDYVIDHQGVLDIIYVLDNQGRQIERTPKSFLQSGEEDLRNTLLVGLNTVFEGRATGETFMATGKTDIYLNINKGNILVFECKFWGGKKLHCATIDQLLSYLTWRNNYGVVVVFSRIGSFTRVLNESKDIIKQHSSYRNGFRELSTSHFVSQHRLPADELKNVELHHLFYNLFTG
jgi:hypothetical protein